MKHYYYSENEQKFGPFLLEELKDKRLKKTTLVWTDGLSDWTIADNFEELKGYLISVPPPLPKKETNKPRSTVTIRQPIHSVINDKYDLTYKRETDATLFGVFALLLALFIVVFRPFKIENDNSYNQYRTYAALINLAYRIAITYWVINISKRQNRNFTAWGWFAFFVPTLALIISGISRKLKLRIEIDGNLPKEDQVLLLMNKAKDFYKENRFQETIEVLEKVIEIDKENFEAILIKAKSLYQNEQFEKSKKDFEILIAYNQFIEEVNLFLGLIESHYFNFEKAIEYWKIAQESGNKNAIIYLDLFLNFKAKYFLKKDEIKKKLGEVVTLQELESNEKFLKYRSGFSFENEINNIEKWRIEIKLHKYGFQYKLINYFKSFEFCINYSEIKEVSKFDTEVTFLLIDDTKVSFDYDFKNDKNKVMNRILNDLKKTTGLDLKTS